MVGADVSRAAEVGSGTAGLPATGEEPGFNWEEEMDKPLRWFSKLAMMFLPCVFELKNWPFFAVLLRS